MISAVKSGQGIRVVLNTNEHVVSVDNIEYNAMEDDFAAMDIWRITAGWEYVPNVGGHHVFSVSTYAVKVTTDQIFGVFFFLQKHILWKIWIL